MEKRIQRGFHAYEGCHMSHAYMPADGRGRRKRAHGKNLDRQC